MDIDTLPAGPELDALIATDVMGCRVVHCRDGTYKLKVPGSFDRVDFVTAEGARSACPKYSTDWAAVGEVLDKLDAWSWELINHGEGVTMTIFKDATHYEATADTVPLAICRAALKAVEGSKL